MNTIGSRGPSLRGYQWRKVVLDLNAPPCEIIEQEGTSEQVGLKEVACQPVHPASPATIDVEVIDDDVTETSATAFAEAKNNSRRSSGRTVVDVDSGWLTRSTNNNQNKHRRPPPSQTVINCDHYINLESTPQFIERHVWLVIRSKDIVIGHFLLFCPYSVFTQVKEILKPQPPPTFNCPICMGPLTEEMSTRCGHIFCKACIKAAIAVQRKCPTCRKKVTVKELFRVFLPSAS